MRKKQKDGEASGDEKKDGDDNETDEKKPPSPSREETSQSYFDPASRPPGYCSLSVL